MFASLDFPELSPKFTNVRVGYLSHDKVASNIESARDSDQYELWIDGMCSISEKSSTSDNTDPSSSFEKLIFRETLVFFIIFLYDKGCDFLLFYFYSLGSSIFCNSYM